MSSLFSCVKVAPNFELTDLKKSFDFDIDMNKINLSTKTCRAEDGSAWLMPFLRRVEVEMATDAQMNHEYYHPLGNQQFRDSSTRFLLGDNHQCVTDRRAFAVQTLGGNTGLRLALEFLTKQMNYKRFYLSAQTSDDQKHVFKGHNLSGETLRYFYWDPVTRNISFQDMLEDLRSAPEDSVIVLQVCCHNPTGCDLTKKQWIQVADIMQERKLFPLFDAAYLGLASGNPEEDAWPVRYFADRGFELLCSQTFSTNLGIYDCRIGNLIFIVNDKSLIPDILSELTWNFYNIYGTPAQHGTKLVLNVLESPVLRLEWLAGLKKMCRRLHDLRSKLSKTLMSLDSRLVEEWSHICKQKGLFCYTGLSGEQVDYLRKNRHVYMERNGSINISALNENNIEYVASSIHHAVQNYSSIFNNNNIMIITNANAG